MNPLILAVDSGLDGALVWMRGGVVLHHVLTRTLVKDGAIDMRQLGLAEVIPRSSTDKGRIAYLEEPFNAAISGGASTSGYTDQCKRWGRLQGWLESWGYEVRGVQAKTWQREILDLARFEVRAEKPCALRLAPGWTLQRPRIGTTWRLRDTNGGEWSVAGASKVQAVFNASNMRIGATTATKLVLSHDTKAASIAYAREHFPSVELVPPRCKNPHDGLADALCIAAWATKKATP